MGTLPKLPAPAVPTMDEGSPYSSRRKRKQQKHTLTPVVMPVLLKSSPCDSKVNPPDGSDHDVTLWFTVIAHALQAVHLGQVVDDSAVISVHGREAVAFLVTFPLVGRRED